jgi:hypothetical protein
MNRSRLRLLEMAFLLLCGTTLSTGCAVPGSALGILKLSGHIDNHNASDEALKVRVLLPKAYGLGGLDPVFEKPEDDGNSDRARIQTVDPDGNFVFKHEVVYHITFFIVPPLGNIPKTPPPPVYLVGFSDCRDEVYWVDFKGNRPRYKAYRMPHKQEIPADKATWTIFDGAVEEIEVDGRKALDIVLKIRKT